MKRKVVQHGPSTLTISLPSDWARRHRIVKGDEVEIQQHPHAIAILPGQHVHEHITLSVGGHLPLLPKILGALYKLGHTDITLEYTHPAELKSIHALVDTRHIGFEIVDEQTNTVRIKAVTHINEQEFAALFRRLFHFLNAVADETVSAQTNEQRDVLRIRDGNIDKLANLLRRIIHKRGQQSYRSDIALYHIVEQLEKIGDWYRDLNAHFIEYPPREEETEVCRTAHELLCSFTALFFRFSLERCEEFLCEYRAFIEHAQMLPSGSSHHLRGIGHELYNLISPTMMLYL